MTRVRRVTVVLAAASMVAALVACAAVPARAAAPEDQARQILAAAGVQGGLVVHLGCGDGRLTAALRAGDAYVVHGLDADAASVARARETIRGLGVYGDVSVDVLAGGRLPYVDNLVSLLVISDSRFRIPETEVRRGSPDLLEF